MPTPPSPLPARTEPRVLLAVCGGIAAYKSCEIVRRLIDAGCSVRVLMTRNAERFVGRLTFSTLSGHPVLVDPLEADSLSGAEHIDLTLWADLALVAPATANTIGKVANGIADDFVSTTLCSFDKPQIWAPAMNHRMWANPAVLRNVRTLREQGATLIEPGSGWLACGETGPGRLAEVDEIVQTVLHHAFGTQELAGRVVLVSAGPTVEDIDDVRFLSNRSTGTMGFELARAAQRMGAIVRLVAGPVNLPTPLGVCRTNVRSAAEMKAAIERELDEADVFISCAAVADYSPVTQPGKIKKGDGPLKLELPRTADILQELAPRKQHRLFVGFALESGNALAHGQDKLTRKKLDLICINDTSEPGAGFGPHTNRLTLLYPDGRSAELPLSSKADQALGVMRAVLDLLKSRDS